MLIREHGSVGGASGHKTAAVVPRFVAREKQRSPLQCSARARSRGEKEHSHEHVACAAGGWRARGGVCKSQRDVNFVSHWCSRGEQMEHQVRYVVGVVFIYSISRLSASFPLSIFGLLLVRSWGRGRVLVFCGWSWRGRSAESVQSALGGRLDVWLGVAEVWRFIGSRGTTRYKAQRSVEEI